MTSLWKATTGFCSITTSSSSCNSSNTNDSNSSNSSNDNGNNECIRTVILLNGYSCSGKDTVGKYLMDYADYRRFAFADQLKLKVSTEYGIPLVDLHTEHGKSTLYTNPNTSTDNDTDSIISHRQILINEGFSARQNDPDVFVKHVKAKILKCKNNNIVITDLRYINEYEYLINNLSPDNYRIITIRINNDRLHPSDDPSEHQFDEFKFDYTISNNSSYTYLYNQIEKVMRSL